jgi:hypothetical protein
MFDGFMQPFRPARPAVEHSRAVLPVIVFASFVGALVLLVGWAQ